MTPKCHGYLISEMYVYVQDYSIFERQITFKVIKVTARNFCDLTEITAFILHGLIVDMGLYLNS